MATTKIVYTKDIPKNDKELYRVSLDQLHGFEYINIRLWYTDTDGILKPSQKGVYIPTEKYDDLINALEELAVAMSPTFTC